MDADSWFSVLALFILVLLSAYFSATETAFSALNHRRIKNLAESSDVGSKRAKLVMALYAQFDKVIATVLVANNICNLVAAAVATVFFINLLGDIGAGVSTLTLTVVLVVFADITPKTLAKEYSEAFALRSVLLLRFFMVLFTPLNFFFGKWRTLLWKLTKHTDSAPAITEQELITVVEEAEHEGVIDEGDKELIHNAIDFSDRKTGDILTPRMDIVGVARDAALDEIAATFLKSGYSRLPVYSDSIDNIIGIVRMRDIFDYYTNKNTDDILSIASEPVFVAPSLRISELFKLLQKQKLHMAIVTDEYGGTDGIVTMEDILEELVGEIWDESDEVKEEIVPIAANTYKVLGSTNIDDFFEHFALPEQKEAESTSVSGWIMDMLEKIPEEGDNFTVENLAVTVHKTENRRVLECIITVESEESEKEGDDLA